MKFPAAFRIGTDAEHVAEEDGPAIGELRAAEQVVDQPLPPLAFRAA